MTTTQEIYDELITDKETKASLAGMLPAPETSEQFVDDVTSGSKVAFWRHLFWIFAELGRDLRNAFLVHESDVEDKLMTRLAPSLPWYQQMVFAFQYGHELVYANGQYLYLTDDAGARIVSQCAVLEANRGLSIKVAKGSGAGTGPLDAIEATALLAYIRKRRVPGTKVTLINENAELLKLDIGVYIDEQVINVNGELIDDTSVRPVDDAINAYLEKFTTTDFNGIFRISDLEDAIQEVTGVIDVDIRSVEYKYGAFDYASVAVNRVSSSGYMAIDVAYPLTDVIDYLTE